MAEVVVGPCEVGLEADRLAEHGDRLILLACLGQDNAEVAVGPGVLGPQADGFTADGLRPARSTSSPASRRPCSLRQTP